MLICDTLTMLDEVSVKCYFNTYSFLFMFESSYRNLPTSLEINTLIQDTIIDVGICSNKT